MQHNVSSNGSIPIQISNGSLVSLSVAGTFASAGVTLQLATTQPVAATLAVNDAVETPALNLFANTGGTQGNNYTIALVDSGAANALAASQVGTDFVITLATDAGDAAAVTTAMAGADNDITVTADADGVIGNSYSIELLAGSGATQALSVSTTDKLKFLVTLGRVADAIASTATEVVDALNAYTPFAALMTAAVKSGDSGAGVVIALAETALTGGGANHAITTTSLDVVNLINTNSIFAPHFTAELEGAYDGSSLSTALAETPLAGGTYGTFITAYPIISNNTDGSIQVRNAGVSKYMQITTSGASGSTDLTAVINKISRV